MQDSILTDVYINASVRLGKYSSPVATILNNISGIGATSTGWFIVLFLSSPQRASTTFSTSLCQSCQFFYRLCSALLALDYGVFRTPRRDQGCLLAWLYNGRSPFYHSRDASEGGAQDQLQEQIASAKIPLSRMISPVLYWVMISRSTSITQPKT